MLYVQKTLFFTCLEGIGFFLNNMSKKKHTLKQLYEAERTMCKCTLTKPNDLGKIVATKKIFS